MSLYLGCIADDFTGATRRARGVTTGDARLFAIRSGAVRRQLGQYQCAIDDGLLVTVKLYLLLKGLDVRLLNDDQVAEVRAAFPN